MEKLHLQEIIDRLRARLHRDYQPVGAAAQGPIPIPIYAEERGIRVALFSAEIDLAYHSARCTQCLSVTQVAAEELVAA